MGSAGGNKSMARTEIIMYLIVLILVALVVLIQYLGDWIYRKIK